jgi:hypothetical protein
VTATQVLRWSISARPNSESRWRSARPTAPALASGAHIGQRKLGRVARSRTASRGCRVQLGHGGVRRTAPTRAGARVGPLQLGPVGARQDGSHRRRVHLGPVARVGQLQLGPVVRARRTAPTRHGARASDRSSSARWARQDGGQRRRVHLGPGRASDSSSSARPARPRWSPRPARAGGARVGPLQFGTVARARTAAMVAAPSSARWCPCRTAPVRAGGARPQLGSAESGQESAPGSTGVGRSQGLWNALPHPRGPQPRAWASRTHGGPVACARTAAPWPAPPARAAETRALRTGAQAGKREERP